MSGRKNKTDETGFQKLQALERDYNTGRKADQMHAMASFPQLFDEFPNQFIINTAFLRLADYYRNSNNVIRHAILQVVKSSQAHLRMIMNVEETIRRILPVVTSVDPLARAITLRVLGCMASIVKDRVDVHHNVIRCLDSTEAMEVSAAVFAADRICSQSQKFCSIISGKLAYLVRDDKTPMPLKRRLIRIFGHMFEDITLARLARMTCLEILKSNTDGEYTVAILRTLTKLASHSLIDVQQQIGLLLDQVRSTAPIGIQKVALSCLETLVQRDIDLSCEQIARIFDIALHSPENRIVGQAMLVLTRVFRSPSVLTAFLMSESEAKLTHEYLSWGLTLLTPGKAMAGSMECHSLMAALIPRCKVVCSAHSSDLEVDQELQRLQSQLADRTLESVKAALVTMAGGSSLATTTQNQTQIKALLRFLVDLSVDRGLSISPLVEQILLWMDQFATMSAIFASSLIHVARKQPLGVQSVQNQLLTKLEESVSQRELGYILLLCQIVLQVQSVGESSVSHGDFTTRMGLIFQQIGVWSMTEQYTQNHWHLYLIAQYCCETGWHQLAHSALLGLESTLELTSNYLWISALQVLTEAEANVTIVKHSPGLDLYPLQDAYLRVIGELEEMEAAQVSRKFQLRFCHLRLSFLQISQQCFTILQGLRFRGLNSQEKALGGCADSFNALAHQWTLLRQGVDKQSDMAIVSQQTSCLVLGYALQQIALVDTAMQVSDNDGGMSEPVFNIDPLLIPLLYSGMDSPELGQSNEAVSIEAIQKQSTLKKLQYISENIVTDVPMEQKVDLGEQLLRQFLTVPLSVPRLFFKSS